MTPDAGELIPALWESAVALVHAMRSALVWVEHHLVLLVAAFTVVYLVAARTRRRIAEFFATDRVRYQYRAQARFDPDAEQIWRQAALLARAARSGPWWVPGWAKTVRIILRADGTSPLDFYVEGSGAAAQLLTATPYKKVSVSKAQRRRDKHRDHTVRAEFLLAGPPAARLREVPLEPDPLQPLVDALATLRADLGDLAEIHLDMQAVPTWRLRFKQWQVLGEARAKAHSNARRESRAAHSAALDAEDSLRAFLSDLVGGDEARAPRRMVVPARPRPVDRAKALGKLQDSGLLQVQILVRCSSDEEGRAEARLAHISAALDVFSTTSRLRPRGVSVGPLRIRSDHRLYRRSFDRRFTSGHLTGPSSWVHAEEIAGLLKPPTVHCTLPLLASDLPVYTPGAKGLLPLGWYTGPDGIERLIASRLSDTRFSLRIGKSDYGKTTQALVQFVALAHAGEGSLYIDPHGDTFADTAPYLAHPEIMERLWHIDLSDRVTDNDQAHLGTWNTLGLEHGQSPAKVAQSVVDTFTAVLGWSDQSHPRAMTLFTKSVGALLSVNEKAVAAGLPDRQATLFQIVDLLGDPVWRGRVVEQLPAQEARWWRTTFLTYPDDAANPITNPLDRLKDNPAFRAFLGCPTSSYNVRHAMDSGKLLWLSLSTSGPSSRLLVATLFNDLYRAGLSRRDTAPDHRVECHVFGDEQISTDAALSGPVFASICEELRKFGIRMHVLAQLPQRLSKSTLDSLLQNASILSTTAGSTAAVSVIAQEWDGRVDVAEVAQLDRFQHYISIVHDGRRLGPLLIRGPQLEEVFGAKARPRKVGQLQRRVLANLGARPVHELLRTAAAQSGAVAAFLDPNAPSRQPDARAPQDEGGPTTPDVK